MPLSPRINRGDLSPQLQRALGSPRSPRAHSPAKPPAPPELYCYLCGKLFPFQVLPSHVPNCSHKWVKIHKTSTLPYLHIPKNPWNVKGIDYFNKEAWRCFRRYTRQVVPNAKLGRKWADSPEMRAAFTSMEVVSPRSSPRRHETRHHKSNLAPKKLFPSKDARTLPDKFSLLPFTVVSSICQFSAAADVLRLRVNKRLESIIGSEEIWKELSFRDFSYTTEDIHQSKDRYQRWDSWNKICRSNTDCCQFMPGYRYKIVSITCVSLLCGNRGLNREPSGISGIEARFIKKNLTNRSDEEIVSMKYGVSSSAVGFKENEKFVQTYEFEKKEMIDSLDIAQDKESGIPFNIRIRTTRKDVFLGKTPIDDETELKTYGCSKKKELIGVIFSGEKDKVTLLKPLYRDVPYQDYLRHVTIHKQQIGKSKFIERCSKHKQFRKNLLSNTQGLEGFYHWVLNLPIHKRNSASEAVFPGFEIASQFYKGKPGYVALPGGLFTMEQTVDLHSKGLKLLPCTALCVAEDTVYMPSMKFAENNIFLYDLELTLLDEGMESIAHLSGPGIRVFWDSPIVLRVTIPLKKKVRYIKFKRVCSESALKEAMASGMKPEHAALMQEPNLRIFEDEAAVPPPSDQRFIPIIRYDSLKKPEVDGKLLRTADLDSMEQVFETAQQLIPDKDFVVEAMMDNGRAKVISNKSSLLCFKEHAQYVTVYEDQPYVAAPTSSHLEEW